MTGARANLAEHWRISTEQDVRTERAVDDLESRGGPRPAPAPAPPLGEHTPRNNRRRRWLLLVLLVLLVLGGTTVVVLSPKPTDTVTDPLPADTDAPFPSNTASDVVSYADHVALVTAISETEAPPESTPPGTFPPGETAIYRQVTFRIDATLWSRADAPTAPKQFTALWWGWLVKGATRRPFIVRGAPAVFVGAQYVVPIAYDSNAFSAIQPFAVFRFNGGAVTPEEQDTPLAHVLTHASRDEIADIFANARPDPLAEKHRHLSPRARLAAVLAARNP